MRKSLMPEPELAPLAPPPAEVMNTSWVVYRVSPLYNFSHDPKNLQKYSKLLAASLEVCVHNRRAHTHTHFHMLTHTCTHAGREGQGHGRCSAGPHQ